MAPTQLAIQIWPIDKLVFYARNPRKNDAAVDRMCSSIREFGFKVPVLARSNGEVVDGHLRLKAARKLGSWPGGDTNAIPVLLCDEWTEAQVRAFRLLVNRSATWAAFDEELLSLELQELNEADFDLSLTGFDPGEIDGLLAIPDEERANATPPVPENPVSRVGDLWICGKHRVLCGDATQAEDVERLLGERKPVLMVTDPPYGIELDSEWRDRAGLNGHAPAEPSYMKKRTAGHTETTISGDTRADWSEAFELVPSLQIAYVWHASKFTREVLNGLLRIGFEHHQQIIWDKGRGPHADPLNFVRPESGADGAGHRCFSTSGQFSTTVNGAVAFSCAGTGTRKRLPSEVTSHAPDPGGSLKRSLGDDGWSVEPAKMSVTIKLPSGAE
jgi:ParB-like nuclease family protein